MKSVIVGIVLACLAFAPAVWADGPEDQYVVIYGLIQQADELSEKGQLAPAVAKYTEARRR